MFWKKKSTTTPKDSDGAHSPTDEEKPVIEKLAHGVLPDDPDAGVSDAERAAIVRLESFDESDMSDILLIPVLGSQAAVETGSQSHSLAVSTLSDFLPRPYVPDRITLILTEMISNETH